MTPFERLKATWGRVEAKFMTSDPIRRLAAGSLTIDHYAAYLRETYFYTRENPQIQAWSTAWFREESRDMVKMFLKHSISEVGHDQLALNDLESMGYHSEGIPSENPLPGTIALTAFAFYGIQFRSLYTYLGYLYFLEFLPTSKGRDLANALRNIGVPERSLSFMQEHNTVDLHHNQLMRVYADKMLQKPEAEREVAYAMEATGDLYRGKLSGAFEAVDSGSLFSLRCHSDLRSKEM
jgi:pyrroloquinoline quinone (PQQ) biosynthesis protein C